ncbi:conserved hypothetical protein [Trichinella spiralis]|uniref:hypothetical protein n=1 Tax=Trichinella spiralis TaxID=6334 RepID=UPI0001EFCB37|nr:conserved hypothetical protein [Trichinella spiralis]
MSTQRVTVIVTYFDDKSSGMFQNSVLNHSNDYDKVELLYSHIVKILTEDDPIYEGITQRFIKWLLGDRAVEGLVSGLVLKMCWESASFSSRQIYNRQCFILQQNKCESYYNMSTA